MRNKKDKIEVKDKTNKEKGDEDFQMTFYVFIQYNTPFLFLYR